MRRILHHLLDHRQRLFYLRLRHFKDKLVVDLQQHLRRKLVVPQCVVHADHGAADNVGGRALQSRIYGGALVKRTHRGVRGADFRVMAFAPEQRQHVAVLLGERLGGFDIVANAGKALEILFDIGAGFLAGDAELVGEPESRDAVDNTEIDCFGAAADFGGHAFHRHAEHFGSRHGVNIESLAKRLLQRRDATDLGQQPQFDLRIVGRNELVAGCRNEGAADLAAILGADRNILQIRIGR